MKYIILLSGGLDSWILANHLLQKHRKGEIMGLTFDWGYNFGEVSCAKIQAEKLGIKQEIIKIPPFKWSDVKSKIEVPLRNMIFLSYACSIAESKGISAVYYATHYPANRYMGRYYHDCSPQFVERFNKVSEKVKVKTPFLHMSLEEMLMKHKNLEYGDFIHFCNNLQTSNCGLCGKCMDVISAFYNVGIVHNFDFMTTPFKLAEQNRINKLKHALKSSPFLFEVRYYHNDRCQLDCDFCYYGWNQQEVTELSHKDKLRVIDRISGLGIRQIIFSGREPLIDDEIFSLINHFGILGGKSDINTNGLNLDKYYHQIETMIILGYLKRILISFTEGEHFKLKALEKLLKIREKYKEFILQPYLVVSKENYDSILQLIQLLHDMGCNIFYVRPLMSKGLKGRKKKSVTLTVEEERKLLENIANNITGGDITIEFPIQHHPGEIKWFKPYYQNLLSGIPPVEKIGDILVKYKFVHNFCMAYWLSLTILPNGDVVGCAKHTYKPLNRIRERYVIGNILSKNFTLKTITERIAKSSKKLCFGD
jgi:7-cyano-7-deazaguanine synthase in queuosine biosynthesis/MoaA/NifB/PqqE/SkfB family radical SAM enzyme